MDGAVPFILMVLLLFSGDVWSASYPQRYNLYAGAQTQTQTHTHTQSLNGARAASRHRYLKSNLHLICVKPLYV